MWFYKLLCTCASFGRTTQCSHINKVKIFCRFFRYFFDFAILVNAIFIAVPMPKHVSTPAEWFFIALFTMEIFLKLYAYGPRRFVSQFWNV